MSNTWDLDELLEKKPIEKTKEESFDEFTNFEKEDDDKDKEIEKPKSVIKEYFGEEEEKSKSKSTKAIQEVDIFESIKTFDIDELNNVNDSAKAEEIKANEVADRIKFETRISNISTSTFQDENENNNYIINIIFEITKGQRKKSFIQKRFNLYETTFDSVDKKSYIKTDIKGNGIIHIKNLQQFMKIFGKEYGLEIDEVQPIQIFAHAFNNFKKEVTVKQKAKNIEFLENLNKTFEFIITKGSFNDEEERVIHYFQYLKKQK